MPNIKLRPYTHASSFRRVAAVAWNAPREPNVYGTVEIRAEKLLAWLDAKKVEGGPKPTITSAVARAVALVLRAHPDCNAMVRWGGLQLRESIDVFMQVAVPPEDGKRIGSTDLSGHCIRSADKKGVMDITEELGAAAGRIRRGDDKDFETTKKKAHRIPGWLFRPLLRLIEFLQYGLNIDTRFLGAPRDPFGCAAVTSVGMLGIRVGYAAFFPVARHSMVILVGTCEDRPVIEDGAVVVGKVLTLNGTFDHRIIDGFHAATLSREIRALLEDPERLDG